MALQTTSQLLRDGRLVVMQFTGVSDGSGDELLALKADAHALTGNPRSLKIHHIDYNVSGGIVRLFWDADDPTRFLDLAGDGFLDYESIGGMVNGGGPGVTGNVLLSTMGFDTGSSYTIKLEMKKKF